MQDSAIPWPHAPTHRLAESGTYIVTAGTYHKAHFFRSADRLRVLQRGLLKVTAAHHWALEAWAIFSNHYHFVAHSPPASNGGAGTLSPMLAELHQKTCAWVNKLEGLWDRKVWHNFWETKLSHPTSYFARLHYVHQNPVRHGLVPVANQYPWCSAGWFERTASAAQVKTIYRFGIDRIDVGDEYEPSTDW
jgi:putative transposase